MYNITRYLSKVEPNNRSVGNVEISKTGFNVKFTVCTEEKTAKFFNHFLDFPSCFLRIRIGAVSLSCQSGSLL